MHAFLIDDNEQVLGLARRLLSEAGYEVTTASDFREANLQLLTHSPDAVVVDVRLGPFNGMQLALTARERFPAARIVVMSSWDDPVLIREAGRCGAAYVRKPFKAAELLSALESPQALSIQRS